MIRGEDIEVTVWYAPGDPFGETFMLMIHRPTGVSVKSRGKSRAMLYMELLRLLEEKVEDIPIPSEKYHPRHNHYPTANEDPNFERNAA